MYDKNLETQGYIPNYSKVFSHRSQVMEAWSKLLGSIHSNIIDTRHYELVALAAARTLNSSYGIKLHARPT